LGTPGSISKYAARNARKSSKSSNRTLRQAGAGRQQTWNHGASVEAIARERRRMAPSRLFPASKRQFKLDWYEKLAPSQAPASNEAATPSVSWRQFAWQQPKVKSTKGLSNHGSRDSIKVYIAQAVLLHDSMKHFAGLLRS
jgi:hypothetical protein